MKNTKCKMQNAQYAMRNAQSTSHVSHYKLCIVHCALCIALLAGCAHYKWGSQLPAVYRDVAVPVFANKTHQPELEALLTQNVRREILSDGALRLKDLDAAAIIIKAEIKTFDSRAVRFSDDMRDLPVEFRVTMAVETWVEDLDGNRLLPKKLLTQNTTVVPTHRVGANDGASVPVTDLPTAKQDAAIRLSALLARDILFYVNTPNK